MTEGQIEVEHVTVATAAVLLRGEHDIYTVPALRSRLGELHEQQLNVILDLSQTAFLDSSVLGAMLGATEHARAHGKEVAVVLGDPPTETVGRIFEVTGLAEVLPTCATREQAHELFARAGTE